MLFYSVFLLFTVGLSTACEQCYGNGFGPCRKSYPIVLSNCGPDVCLPPPVDAPPIFAPPQDGPLIHLPCEPAPPPRVIAHKCICSKTVVKPQVIRRLINVPQVTRYLRRSYKPVVENIAYKASPRCSACEPYPLPLPGPCGGPCGVPPCGLPCGGPCGVPPCGLPCGGPCGVPPCGLPCDGPCGEPFFPPPSYNFPC